MRNFLQQGHFLSSFYFHYHESDFCVAIERLTDNTAATFGDPILRLFYVQIFVTCSIVVVARFILLARTKVGHYSLFPDFY